MRQKFSIPNWLLAVLAAVLVLGAAGAYAADVQVVDSPPARYTVQKGDTLWGISARFLKDPWRWPDIWRMNREEIHNPHLIYPGDVIVLDKADGQWRLSLERPTTRLSPTVRVSPLEVTAIPMIPVGDIEPYLTRPLITGPEGLVGSGQIVAGRDARVIRGDGDVVYAVDIDAKAGDLWYIYRPGRQYLSPDGNELLGVEQRFLGMAKVDRFASVATLRIASANEEILVGDRLIPAPRGQLITYAPHAPDRPIDGQIIATNRSSNEVGRGWVVTIDKGARDQINIGTVLAIYRRIAPIPDPRGSAEVVDPSDPTTERSELVAWFLPPPPILDVPEERSGLLFIFRVFDKLSYGIVLNTSEPVHVGDLVRNP